MSEEQAKQETKEVAQTDEANSFAMLQRKAKLLASSDLVPQQYRGDNPRAISNCIIAMQLSERIGADYLMVMQNLHVIQGKPSWSSQFIISAINSCGRFSPLRFEMSGEGENMACYAYAIEKATGETLKGPKVTMKMAKQEGWIDKSGSKWKTMPEVMIRYRAASFFGKLYAPEILNGMQTVEEVMDSDEPRNVSPEQQGSTADKVKSKLKEKTGKTEEKQTATPAEDEKQEDLEIY